MSRIKNTMKLVEEAEGAIDTNYDIHNKNVEDIFQASNSLFDMIYFGFRFGYMRGMKAERSKSQKGGIVA